MAFGIGEGKTTMSSPQFSPEELNNCMSFFKGSGHIHLLPTHEDHLSIEDQKKMAILNYLCKTKQLVLGKLDGLNTYSLPVKLSTRVRSKVTEILINCLKG